MTRFLTVALTGALLLCACETPDETIVGEPPEDEPIAASRKAGPKRIALPGEGNKQPQGRHPQAIFGAAVWPYLEEGTTFELVWGGEPAAVALREQPSLNGAVVADYHLQRDDTLPWRQTWVGVYKPALFVAKTSVTLHGQRHAPQDRDMHQSPVTERIAPGESIAVYHYAGGATCYVGAKKTLMQAACPSPDRFDGDFSGRTRAEQMHPEERIWWVFIETEHASGWLPVDDRVFVDIVSL